jgi:hypothetical protein
VCSAQPAPLSRQNRLTWRPAAAESTDPADTSSRRVSCGSNCNPRPTVWRLESVPRRRFEASSGSLPLISRGHMASTPLASPKTRPWSDARSRLKRQPSPRIYLNQISTIRFFFSSLTLSWIRKAINAFRRSRTTDRAFLQPVVTLARNVQIAPNCAGAQTLRVAHPCSAIAPQLRFVERTHRHPFVVTAFMRSSPALTA